MSRLIKKNSDNPVKLNRSDYGVKETKHIPHAKFSSGLRSTYVRMGESGIYYGKRKNVNLLSRKFQKRDEKSQW